jgi:PAS domain S-box-containing protein
MCPSEADLGWPPGFGEMARRLRGHPWDQSPLGAFDTWPGPLKTLVAIMTSSSQPMFIVWGSERTLLYNDGYAEILAAKHPDALGRDVLDVWHEIRDDLEPIVGEAYAGRPVYMDDITLQMQRKGFLEETHFSFSYTPIFEEDGGVSGFFCPCTEITRQILAERALRSSEERQAFLVRLGDALRPVEDAVEVQDLASRLLGEHLGANRIAYAEDAGDGETVILTRNYTKDVPGILGRYRYLDYGENLVRELREGRTVVRPDVANYPLLSDEEKAAHSALQLGATLNVPLVKAGNLVAILAVHYVTPHDFTEDEIELVQEVAERTWAAVERARSEARRHESDELYRLIVKGARDYAIFTIDEKGTITSWPPGAAAIFGWSEDEMIGQAFAKTFTEEDRAAGAPVAELAIAARDGIAPDIRWHLKSDGSRVFIEGAVLPLERTGPGRRGFIKIGQDVTDRRRAADRLAESETRLSAIFAGASVGLSEISPEGRLLRVNDELCRILGRTRDELLGLTVADVTHPEDLPKTLKAVERVLRGEERGADSAIDKRYVRPDGSVIWASSRATLLPQNGAGPGHLLAVTVDLSDRKAAELAVRESEARFRQFGDASSDALWIRDAGTLEWEYLSRAFDRIYVVSRQDALKSRNIDFLMNLIVPEDREGTLSAIRDLRDRDRVYEYRIRRPSDGAVRWLRTTGFRLLGPDGVVQRLGGITQDATEEKETTDRMDVLLAELQHRTRNLIGVVRAMASRTLRASTSVEDFRDRFGDRLEALARVNGLLSRLEEGERVTFDELLATEIEGHGLADEIGPGGKVSLRGPGGVSLPSASVQTLALALHELLTNAAKHGALRHGEGRLSIAWDILEEAEPKLWFEWRETGFSVDQGASQTPGRGYGRELIERALPFQLGARTTYELGQQGLLCVVTLPVPRRKARRGNG